MSYRDSVSGRFAKSPVAKPVAFNAKRNAQEIVAAVNSGDYSAVKGKISTFLGKVKATTPLEEVVVAMLREYCS